MEGKDWISVKDRLPDIGVKVRVKIGCTSMGGVKYHEDEAHVINETGRFSKGFDWCVVYYWQPLPKPPGEI